MIDTLIDKGFLTATRGTIDLLTILAIAYALGAAYQKFPFTVATGFALAIVLAGLAFLCLIGLREWDEKNRLNQRASIVFRWVCVLTGVFGAYLMMYDIYAIEGTHLRNAIYLFALFTTIKQKEE